MSISITLDKLVDRIDVICSLPEVVLSEDPAMLKAKEDAEMAAVDPIEAYKLLSAAYTLIYCIDKKPMSMDMRAALFDLNRVLSELMEEEN